MSKRTRRAIHDTLNIIGWTATFFSMCLIVFVLCCIDSEGREAFAFLLHILTTGVLLLIIGRLLIGVSEIMKNNEEGRRKVRYVPKR